MQFFFLLVFSSFHFCRGLSNHPFDACLRKHVDVFGTNDEKTTTDLSDSLMKLFRQNKMLTFDTLSRIRAGEKNKLSTAKDKKSSGKIVKSKQTTSIRGLISYIVNFLKDLLFSSDKESSLGILTKKSKNTLDVTYRPGDANLRIQKELRTFMANPPSNCKVTLGSNIRVWVVTIVGVNGTIYAGEKYRLKMVFPKEYPSKPPAVYFLKPTPRHQHVYSNGDICLNLLGRDWRPTMTSESLIVSILSMLSSAKEKKMPVDNAMHADAPPGQQQDNWMYHDDKC